MKLYVQILKLLFRKFILRRSNGVVVRDFATKMGLVYIKFAQILATQNFGNLFTEADRVILSTVCDSCNPIPYAEIETALRREYGERFETIFRSIDPEPVGSASISQVHRAVLCTGEEVAVKVRRHDIARAYERDLRRIKALVHRFGRLFHFQNLTGGDRALDLYLSWIEQEIDFHHECQNLQAYRAFADNVNGRVPGTTRIRVPRLYAEYCTNNVIVMEFVHAPTINQLELTAQNKSRIATALNSYLKLSFWAMFHDQTIVFHGDPHSGNICIDDENNLWFLDLGLIFTMNDSDAKMCRQFFLAAYARNADKLYEMLVGYGDMDTAKKSAFYCDCRQYCDAVKTKDITCYFTDMITVCLKYEFVPPNFLFGMAKAFLCLRGISHFIDNPATARELLQAQTLEYLLRRSFNDCRKIAHDGLCFFPELIIGSMQNGFVHTLAQTVATCQSQPHFRAALNHFEEMTALIKLSLSQ